MNDKHKLAYMKTALNFAECSTARRLQVGCIIVKDNRIISIGYNGTPSGWSNNCELEEETEGEITLKTKPEVLHAESNAITKLAGSTESGKGAVAFVTHQPCLECAKLLYQTGIREVYYLYGYRSSDGVEFLKKSNIYIEQLTLL